MKSKQSKLLLGLIAVAVLSTMFAEVSAAESTNSMGEVGANGTTYEFTLTGEGQSWGLPWPGSTLSSISDRDTFVMTLTTTLKITVIVADCCLMGDTIAIFYPTSTTVKVSATSPNIIKKTATIKAGTYKFWVGYTRCPGGFPASYFIWVIATHA